MRILLDCNLPDDVVVIAAVDEHDFNELEDRYWKLKSQSTSGKFDLATFQKIVCPPFPESIAPGRLQTEGWSYSKLMSCMLACIFVHMLVKCYLC